MTSRRSFLRSLSIGAAAIYLRIAPDIAAAIPRGLRATHGLEDGEYDVCYLRTNDNLTLTRLAPTKWDGSVFVPPPEWARFSVRNGMITRSD